MKKRYLSIFIFILVIASSIFTSSKANAQEYSQMLTISPIIIPLELSPGKKVTQVLTVENKLTTPLPIRVTTSDFDSSDEDGGFIFKNTITDLSTWIRIEPKEFILAPKEKRKVTATITIPQQISLGGYQSIIFFEPVIPTLSKGSLVGAKIGSLIFANIGIIDPSATIFTIQSFSPEYFLNDNADILTFFRIQNMSLAHTSAKPSIRLSGLLSGLNRRFDIEEKYIFPGKIRRWEYLIESGMYIPGIYKLTLHVPEKNGTVTQAESFIVFAPLRLYIILFLTLLLSSILVITRKRLLKSIRALKE